MTMPSEKQHDRKKILNLSEKKTQKNKPHTVNAEITPIKTLLKPNFKLIKKNTKHTNSYIKDSWPGKELLKKQNVGLKNCLIPVMYAWNELALRTPHPPPEKKQNRGVSLSMLINPFLKNNFPTCYYQCWYLYIHWPLLIYYINLATSVTNLNALQHDTFWCTTIGWGSLSVTLLSFITPNFGL